MTGESKRAVDEEMTLQQAKSLVQAFCEARDWDQFHDPKELAIGMSTEANELLEIFRFQSREQMQAMMADPQTREHVCEELADVFFFVLRFAQMNGIDLGSALQDKVEKNDRKYPVEKARGRNEKADRL